MFLGRLQAKAIIFIAINAFCWVLNGTNTTSRKAHSSACLNNQMYATTLFLAHHVAIGIYEYECTVLDGGVWKSFRWNGGINGKWGKTGKYEIMYLDGSGKTTKGYGGDSDILKQDCEKPAT